jgi:hypothetical protein
MRYRTRVFGGAGLAGDALCLLLSFDSPPVVRRWSRSTISPMSERQIEPVRRAMIGITAVASLDMEKAERHSLTDGWRNRVVMDPVVGKLIDRDRKLSVVVAAVVSKLDLDA